MRQNLSKIPSSDAVSPVVGVMLMLVVVIIIAAVVSAFAGGLVTGQKKAPSVSVETMIKNTGQWSSGTNMYIKILSASEVIPTKDIKIITSWNSSLGYKGGKTITGPNITSDGSYGDPNAHYGTPGGTTLYKENTPLGYGPLVGQQMSVGTYPEQQFGNYSLTSGTWMRSGATSSYGANGAAKYEYCEETCNTGTWATDKVDGLTAMLGEHWNTLRPGETVTVKIVHIPSGKTLYNENIVVTGA